MKVPRHIAVIMDGNGRWAQSRGLPRTAGHQAGVRALREVVEACVELGVEVLTIFAFSTENWRRPGGEVQALLFELLPRALEEHLEELRSRGVRVEVIGDLQGLPETVRRLCLEAVEKTRSNSRLRLVVAVNYGGRQDIVQAARSLAREAREGRVDPEEIDEGLFASRLYTAGLPDPDLLIRPGGEMRVSNFLLWQLAYTEIWVTPVLWPDFGRRELLEAVDAYRKRERRFGGLPARNVC